MIFCQENWDKISIPWLTEWGMDQKDFIVILPEAQGFFTTVFKMFC
jgi:hypothetical protein